MATFSIDTAADDCELTAEELEIVAGGSPVAFTFAIEAAWALAKATGGEAFFDKVNKVVRG